jgi:uncharacterized protein YqiB (DUF1249 family)
VKIPPPITDVVEPLGPEARAMLEARIPPDAECDYCGHARRKHHDGRAYCLSMTCDCRYFAAKQPSQRPVVVSLLRDVAAGIRVLRDRDGVEITEAQVMERANNIVAGLEGNYHITGTGE